MLQDASCNVTLHSDELLHLVCVIHVGYSVANMTAFLT